MHTHKRSFRTTVFGLLAILLISACNSVTPTPTQELPVIRLGVSKWIGWGAFYIAVDKGLFAKAGVKVDLVYYDNLDIQNADFGAKKLDGSLTVLSDSVTKVAAKVPLQIVWLMDDSRGSDAFVANSAISSPADLKGKRIGLAYGTFGHIFVITGLAKYGITANDVTIVSMSAVDVPQAMADGKIDAGHTWDPHLSQAVKNGARILFTSADTPGIIEDVVQFRTEVVQNRPTEIQTILQVMVNAADYWAKNPDEGNQIVAKAIDVPPSDIPSILAGVHIFSLAEVQSQFNPKATPSIYESIKMMSDFFVSAKVIYEIPDAQSIVNPTFALALK